MTPDRYSHVESRKKEGAHYTPEIIADFISQRILDGVELGEKVQVADPAVGDGELLISLLSALKRRSINHIEVHAFDTNERSLNITRERLEHLHSDVSIETHHKDFLQVCLDRETFLGETDSSIPYFDILIANPPYIRTQVLGADQAKILSQNFGLKGRLDAYQAFLVAMKSVMKSNGVAGVIVSNRFMTTKGAGEFRKTLYDEYSIKGIWDFGDTKVFDAAVLPAVMVMGANRTSSNDSVPFSSVYLYGNKLSKTNLPHVGDQIEALSYSGLVKNSKSAYVVKHGHLTYDSKSSDVWRLQDEESEKWLRKVDAKTWCRFKDIGKVRVGVKTTADNIFIHADWEKEVGYVPELVEPLVTHHVAARFKCNDNEKKSILYTHHLVDGKRSVYDIEKFPITKKYLEANKEQLSSRKYVAKAKRIWYEIWVPQNPALWSEPKVIFRDITEQPTFWMDLDGSIVNGDCYWMIRENEGMPEDILWLLLAVANSEFVEEFYDLKFQNKLYSNKRRFITQYVEQFPVPDPSRLESKEIVKLAKERYRENDRSKHAGLEKNIDHLIWSIFDVPHIDEIIKD
ncbi:Eco57I restriction-modification methylase domain-containing protein [Halomonas sp. GD1P12]|uniref:Eco57I restriction-modification methylase domain-containing protein n=1 Tax=Halomonas sp. GD1P12 TaxID=2982691 RepID=UPI0021E3BD08|nr:N-6 DNA methylase [Halomonas sp. GD1P12]UYF99023.1 N-6 DNA methylase [Halomonas sp. GD1P12]